MAGRAAELIRSDAPKRAEEERSCVLLHSTRDWRETEDVRCPVDMAMTTIGSMGMTEKWAQG